MKTCQKQPDLVCVCFIEVFSKTTTCPRGPFLNCPNSGGLIQVWLYLDIKSMKVGARRGTWWCTYKYKWYFELQKILRCMMVYANMSFGVQKKHVLRFLALKPLSANPTKWSNTLKKFVDKLLMNCLSVFDHFVKLVLKGLKPWY